MCAVLRYTAEHGCTAKIGEPWLAGLTVGNSQPCEFIGGNSPNCFAYLSKSFFSPFRAKIYDAERCQATARSRRGKLFRSLAGMKAWPAPNGTFGSFVRTKMRKRVRSDLVKPMYRVVSHFWCETDKFRFKERKSIS